MWQSFNPNPLNNRVGDCTVRAICKALDADWYNIYIELCLEGLEMADMPSANHVWGSFLRKKGFQRIPMPESCPDCYTVSEFCKNNPHGRFILALNNHVVAIIDGISYDTWDSSDENILYVWKRKEF